MQGKIEAQQEELEKEQGTIEQGTLEDRVRDAEEALEEGKVIELTLSSGVVVLPRPLPDLLISRVYQQVPEPKPPFVEYEDEKGKTRRERNPNDPDFEEEVRLHTLKVSMRLLDVVLLKGFSTVSVPDDIPPLEDDGWVDEAAVLLGVSRESICTSEVARRLAWLQTYVLLTAGDFAKVQAACFALGGVTEATVEAAQNRF